MLLLVKSSILTNSHVFLSPSFTKSRTCKQRALLWLITAESRLSLLSMQIPLCWHNTEQDNCRLIPQDTNRRLKPPFSMLSFQFFLVAITNDATRGRTIVVHCVGATQTIGQIHSLIITEHASLEALKRCRQPWRQCYLASLYSSLFFNCGQE